MSSHQQVPQDAACIKPARVREADFLLGHVGLIFNDQYMLELGLAVRSLRCNCIKIEWTVRSSSICVRKIPEVELLSSS